MNNDVWKMVGVFLEVEEVALVWSRFIKSWTWDFWVNERIKHHWYYDHSFDMFPNHHRLDVYCRLTVITQRVDLFEWIYEQSYFNSFVPNDSLVLCSRLDIDPMLIRWSIQFFNDHISEKAAQLLVDMWYCDKKSSFYQSIETIVHLNTREDFIEDGKKVFIHSLIEQLLSHNYVDPVEYILPFFVPNVKALGWIWADVVLYPSTKVEPETIEWMINHGIACPSMELTYNTVLRPILSKYLVECCDCHNKGFVGSTQLSECWLEMDDGEMYCHECILMI